MTISLIIPAYNEEARLPPFLRSIAAYWSAHPEAIHELIIVDDGSSDATAARAREFEGQLQGLRIIEHEHNKGKGAAVQTGVFAANADAVVFIDADGATPISELDRMRDALERADIGVGNRWMSGAHVNKSTPLRHFAGWVYKTYMSMFGLGGIDTMCGFKGYRIDVARDLFTNLIEHRWLFDTEVAYKAVRRGYTIENFPIKWESIEGSKLDSWTLMKSGFEIFPLVLRIRKQEASNQTS